MADFVNYYDQDIEHKLCVQPGTEEDSNHGLMCPEDKAKLDAIEDRAEVNQEAFSAIHVKDGDSTTTINAEEKTDNFIIKAGDNISITADSDSGEIIIRSAMYEHPTYNDAALELYKVAVDEEGHVSGTSKFDFETEVNNLIPPPYEHPVHDTADLGFYKIEVDDEGHVVDTVAVTSDDLATVGIPLEDTNTTYTLSSSKSSTDGNTKITLTAGGSGSGSDNIAIKGSGATTVTTNAAGEIIISSTDTQHPDYNDKDYTSNLYKIAVENGHVSSATAVTKADIASLLGINSDGKATSSTLGFVKTGYTASGKNYAVNIDSNGSMYVNVPWTNENDDYMTKENPTGTGYLSINRKANSLIGENSSAVGDDVVASGESSHAEGRKTTAIGEYSHAEGYSDRDFPSTIITDESTDNDILGYWKSEAFSLAKGAGSHVEGRGGLAFGSYSHVEGLYNIAHGDYSHAEGNRTISLGNSSHAEGNSSNYLPTTINLTSLKLPSLNTKIKEAWNCLGEVSGTTSDEAIIDKIFSKFCLGK